MLFWIAGILRLEAEDTCESETVSKKYAHLIRGTERPGCFPFISHQP